MIDYARDLNTEQLRVVREGDGPSLVLAGAGSGKTRTLVYRVAWLLEHGVNPHHILLVTFTNKAAREMLDRVSHLIGKNPIGLWGGTFHHIGHRILRMFHTAAGLAPNFTIIDKEDSKTLIKSVISSLNIPNRDKKFPKADVISAIISYSANAQADITELIEKRYHHFPALIKQDIVRIHDAYQEKKHALHVLDFDDLLTRWHALLRTDTPARERLARQFRYILVDEFQDTNRVQSEIIRLLSTAHHNVLVVGDDAQSIYSFRAADVNNILAFPKTFTAAKIFRLEQNYRSIPSILALANHSIIHNNRQYDKKLKAVKDGDALPQLVACADAYEQAAFITERILEHTDEGETLKRMSILFRSSYQVIEMELELAKRSIPYIVRGGLRFFEQAHIKDILAYLRIIHNFHDEISWKRILQHMPGVGPASAERIWHVTRDLDRIRELIEMDQTLIGLPGRAHDPWRQLMKLLDTLSKLLTNTQKLEPDQFSGTAPHPTHRTDALSQSIETILNAGYEAFIKHAYDDASERLEDIRQMALFSKNYAYLDQFLADAALTEGFKGERRITTESGEDDTDRLVLSTIHQAKGLEWNTVFVLGLADGQFPHYKVFEKESEIEEERRLFYVAVTRAEHNLYLTYPIMNHSRMTSQAFNHPSTFLRELPDHLYQTREFSRGIDPTIQMSGGILDRVLETKKSRFHANDSETVEYIDE